MAGAGRSQNVSVPRGKCCAGYMGKGAYSIVTTVQCFARCATHLCNTMRGLKPHTHFCFTTAFCCPALAPLAGKEVGTGVAGQVGSMGCRLRTGCPHRHRGSSKRGPSCLQVWVRSCSYAHTHHHVKRGGSWPVPQDMQASLFSTAADLECWLRVDC